MRGCAFTLSNSEILRHVKATRLLLYVITRRAAIRAESADIFAIWELLRLHRYFGRIGAPTVFCQSPTAIPSRMWLLMIMAEMQATKASCMWRHDPVWLANVSSRGCCPHARQIYQEQDRYSAIDCRCCGGTPRRGAQHLVCSGSAFMRLPWLWSRTVVIIGDSIAQQLFLGILCALWEAGFELQVSILERGQKQRHLLSWTATLLGPSPSRLVFLRQDTCGVLAACADRPYVQMVSAADVIVALPLYNMWRPGWNATGRDAVFHQYLTTISELPTTRAVARHQLVFQTMPSFFAGGYPGNQSAPCTSSATSHLVTQPPATGASKWDWQGSGLLADAFQESSPDHIGDISAYMPGKYDCIHLCVLPGVLDALGMLQTQRVQAMDKARVVRAQKPLEPSLNLTFLPLKHAANTSIKNYHRSDAPLFLWRVMKSGSSTLCHLARLNYPGARESGTCGGPFIEIFTAAAGIAASWASWQDAGFIYVGMEPALPWNWITSSLSENVPFFPSQYHSLMKPFLQPHPSKIGLSMWDEAVHVINVRHPLHRALSAFYFRHDQQHNVLGACEEANLTGVNECLHHTLDVCSGSQSAAALFTKHNHLLPNMIRTQLCGSFLQLHLSTSSAGQSAKNTLKRFSIITDLDGEPQRSAHLLKRVLGWQHVEIARVNANIHGKESLLNTSRLEAYLAADFDIYEYALHLIHQHAAKTGYLDS